MQQTGKRFSKGAVLFGGLALAITLFNKIPVQGQNNGQSEVQRGFAISPECPCQGKVEMSYSRQSRNVLF